MTLLEAKRRLALFRIPLDDAGEVTELLARLLAAGSLVLADVQTMRDVAECLGVDTPEIYPFLAALRLSLKAGNTFLRMERGAELLAEGAYVETDGTVSAETLRRQIGTLWTERVKPIVAQLSEWDLAGVLRVKTIGGTHGPDQAWFFAKVHDAVTDISAKLKALDRVSHEKPRGNLTDDQLRAAVTFRGRNGRSFVLNGQQQEAVRKVAEQSFVVVTGGPGTGKTTVVCAMLRALLERGDLTGEEIALVAPTGRAAQRLGEALHRSCAEACGLAESIAGQIDALTGVTIHSLLGGFPPNWKYTARNRLPFKLVIVDESSMVDVTLMQALLAALPDDCRLVLLGDKDQLPSVDAGAVLGDVVAHFGSETVVELTESKRFAREFAACAAAINRGDIAAFELATKRLPAEDKDWTATLSRMDPENVNRVFRYELSDTLDGRTVSARLVEWASHYGLISSSCSEGELIRLAKAITPEDSVFADRMRSDAVNALFEQLDRSRILTVMREGIYGARGVNELIVRKRFNGWLPANPLEKIGVPVLITRNTRERNLWNGDIGVTVNGPAGLVTLFPRGEKVEVCPIGLLPEHELAYAITIHKSQGSEFGNVLVVLPKDEDNPLLSRPLLYTGVTRAKVRAVVMGTKGAMARAIRHDIVRDSGVE